MGLKERNQRKNEKGRTRKEHPRAEGLHSDRRGIVQKAAWRNPIQVYQREGRKIETRRITYPSLRDRKKDQPIKKNATHGILLAEYEQRGSNYTGKMSGVLACDR